jgi:hypothetical protein
MKHTAPIQVQAQAKARAVVAAERGQQHHQYYYFAALLAEGGLLQGGHVCWLGPSEKTIVETRSWIQALFVTLFPYARVKRRTV